MVAEDADDYVSKAVRLGTDRSFRAAVSEKIVDKRDLLFSERAKEQVASEWGLFMERALRAAVAAHSTA